MKKGSKHSEETLAKIRSYRHSDDAKRRISETCKQNGVGLWSKPNTWNKGKSLPSEMRKKISQTLTGRKMSYVAEANKKRIYSSKTRELRREVAKRNWSNPDYRAKMLSINVKGENNPHYIKDRNKIKISDDRRQDALYKEWRTRVKNRDNWKCKINNSDCRGRLEVHHILHWINNNDLRYEINNGITLCHFHHPHYKDETEEQVKFFKSLIT